MDEIQQENQIVITSNIKCIILVIVEVSSLLFFAIWAKDNGSWEGLRILFSIPVFFIIGLITIIFSLKFIKDQRKNILMWLLFISGIIFITIVPAVYISTKIQNLIYYKEYKEKEIQSKINRAEMEQFDKDSLQDFIQRYDDYYSDYRTVVDVNKNYLLLKRSTGEADDDRNMNYKNSTGEYYSMVYLPSIKNIDEFDSYAKNLIGKDIKTKISRDVMDQITNIYAYDFKESTNGVEMIKNVPILQEVINSYIKDNGEIERWLIYKITLDTNFSYDVPVDIYLNGELLKF